MSSTPPLDRKCPPTEKPLSTTPIPLSYTSRASRPRALSMPSRPPRSSESISIPAQQPPVPPLPPLPVKIHRTGTATSTTLAQPRQNTSKTSLRQTITHASTFPTTYPRASPNPTTFSSKLAHPLLNPRNPSRDRYINPPPKKPSRICQPASHTLPSGKLVLYFLVVFAIFVILLSIAAKYPTPAFWGVILAFGSLSTVSLTGVWAFSLRNSKHRYKPNLGNSIAVVLTTIPTFTTLYAWFWYPQLRGNVLVTSTDTVRNVQFPSIAIFQRTDWSSQANPVSRTSGGGSKCFQGWYDDQAPPCRSAPEASPCTCHDLWYNNDQVIDDFKYLNTTYRYKIFDSPTWFTCRTPAEMLLLQTSFDYNATKSKMASSTRLSPSLLLAVYDPELGLVPSLNLGFTRMSLVSANGIVALNIALRRRTVNAITAYDYSLSLGNSPALELTCDTSSPESYYHDCRLELFVHITSFDRVVTRTRKVLSWGMLQRVPARILVLCSLLAGFLVRKLLWGDEIEGSFYIWHGFFWVPSLLEDGV